MHQHASPGLDRDNIAAVLRSGNKEEVLPVLHLLICAGKATIESLQVLEHVGRLLRHQDAEVASTAAELLAAAGAEGHEEGLIQMLQRVEDVCVRAALSALGKVGPNISPSHKDLVVRHVALCLSGSHRVRSRALRTLGELKAMRQALGIHRFGAKQDPESERAKGGMATRMKIEAQRPEGALQATTDTPRLSKDLKEAQEVIDSLKEAFAASEQRADQQAQLFVQREQHWQNELAQAESLAEVAAQEKDELCAELVEKAKDLKEAQGVIDSLKEALVASEKRADQQAQQFEQREQHWQNEFAHAAAKAESLTEAAAQEKAREAGEGKEEHIEQAREVGEDVKTHVEQDSGSPAKEVDLRRRMEAMFKSKLKGSEWLPWQSCIDSLQSVGCTLQEAKSFLKEYGSWIRVKDFLDILFASPKEKQKLEDFMKMKKPISLCLPLRITFKLRETPSVLSNMADKTFAGRIKPGAKYCYASYPGKFKTGFEALSSDVGEFGDQSVACVYFCKKEDGLGSHHPDPEDSKGRCYCRRIYGEGNDSNRDYQTFGYIHWIGAPYGEKMANAQKVAEAMNAVLVREDASEEEKTHAIREAKRRWNQSGRVAAWGCLWLHVWFGHMKEAVKRRQRLKVVYYPGMVGKGKVTMKDLQDPNVSLWDSDPKNRGLGGSQKAEVAIIEDMRELEGAAWDYDEVDVSEFLKDSFSPGNTVAALDGHEWKRGVIIGVDGLQWKVRCQRTNQVLTTDRVRHDSEAVEKFATIFSEAFGASLPDGEVVATCPREERLEDGVLTMRFDLQCKDVAALKALCSAVLSGHLESAIQDRDDFGRLSAGVHIEKTEFVKAYKHVLMSSIDLTPHQEEKVKELEGDGDFHLSAAAGSGKTFVAVRKVLLTLDANSEGQVLFVAPTKALCLHFLQWFVAMHGGDEADVVKQFARLRLMYAPYNSCMTASLKGNKIELAKDEGPNIQFVLSIVDEAHDIFRTDVEQGVLREILLHSSKQRILLSDASQSGAVKQNYPKEIQFQEKHLSQVVRSTDRIVLGAKSFQLPPESSEQLPTDESSSSCAGPPLKTFLFEPEDAASPSPPFQEYCRYTISALRHVISSYPDLRLHHCVAIIVPNPDFLNRFKPVLEKVLRDPITHKSFLVQHKTPQLPAPLPRPPQLSAPLPRPLLPPPPLPAQLLPPRKPDPADQDELAGKNLRFIDFEESLSYIVTSDTVENCKEECIILDSVDNAKGLEELIVISVGMDAEIGSEGSAAALATRACLYQTITRAQLMALVVNEYVSGGWLEHLALCKLMAGEFDESAGRIESSTGAAAQVVKEIQAKSHQGKFEEGKEGGLFKGTATQTLKTHGAPAQISTAPLPSASETVAGKKEMQSRASVVWDTGHNSIKTPIYELSFDPSRRSTAEAFEMLRKILPGEQLMAVPSTCPYPKKDCLIWQYNHHDSSVVELIIENTSYTEHAFLFCRDGSCLRRYKRYSKKTDAHHDGSELHIFDPEEEWIGSVGEGQFKLEGCTLSGTLRQAKGFAEWRTSDFWSQGRDIDFHYTRKELLSHRLSKREAYLEEKFAELSENKLKDLGMDPQHLWFWQADL